jgi:hypothetical protein
LSLAILSINFSQAQKKMNNEIDSVSYLLGAAIGGNVLNDIPEANKEALLQGLKDKLYGYKPAVTDPTNQMLNNYFQQKAERDAQAAMQEGIRFLEENKKNYNTRLFRKVMDLNQQQLQKYSRRLYEFFCISFCFPNCFNDLYRYRNRSKWLYKYCHHIHLCF